nr:hypothetical protein Iba_chr05eCG8940 [Ipomoea batatas]
MSYRGMPTQTLTKVQIFGRVGYENIQSHPNPLIRRHFVPRFGYCNLDTVRIGLACFRVRVGRFSRVGRESKSSPPSSSSPVPPPHHRPEVQKVTHSHKDPSLVLHVGFSLSGSTVAANRGLAEEVRLVFSVATEESDIFGQQSLTGDFMIPDRFLQAQRSSFPRCSSSLRSLKMEKENFWCQKLLSGWFIHHRHCKSEVIPRHNYDGGRKKTQTGARFPFMVLEPIFVGVRCPLREQGVRLWSSDRYLWEQGAHYGSKVPVYGLGPIFVGVSLSGEGGMPWKVDEGEGKGRLQPEGGGQGEICSRRWAEVRGECLAGGGRRRRRENGGWRAATVAGGRRVDGWTGRRSRGGDGGRGEGGRRRREEEEQVPPPLTR